MKKRNNNSISIETKISQALHFFDKQTGAVVPNIEHSATYSRDKNYQNMKDYWYRRDGNSTTVLAEEIISEHIKEYNFPVCFGFPCGHLDDNRGIRFGVHSILEIHENGASFFRSGSHNPRAIS